MKPPAPCPGKVGPSESQGQWGPTPEATRPKTAAESKADQEHKFKQFAVPWTSQYHGVLRGKPFHAIRAKLGSQCSAKVGVHDKAKFPGNKVPRDFYEGEACHQRAFRSEAAAQCYANCDDATFHSGLFNWIEDNTGPRRS